MTFKVKTIISAIALTMLATNSALAAQEKKKKANEGKFTGMVKLQHVVDAKDNGYDPNSGQAWMLKLKYVTPSTNGLRFGAGFYAVGDIFDVTNLSIDSNGRPASGLYATTNSGSMEDTLKGDLKGILGELYGTYKNKGLYAYGGRMIYRSPLTKSAESTVPDFHTVFGANYKVNKQVKVGLAQMTQVSMGTRAANEYGLMGEGTGTAGTIQRPVGPGSLNRVEFHDVATVALGEGADKTNGMTIVNASYRPSKKLNFSVWDYYAHDIYNAVYLEANHITPMKGKKLKLSGQYLTQSDVGDKLGGDIDFNLFGAKAALNTRKWGAYIALNKSSGDTGMFNAFSGDPGFTSTQFSRNEFRENVSAYKIGGRYSINKQWIVMAAHANYGQSDTNPMYNGQNGVPGVPATYSATTPVKAQKDATVTDIKLIWKPMKKTKIILTHSIRTSEYDGFNGADLTMGHTRLIGMYKF